MPEKIGEKDIIKRYIKSEQDKWGSLVKKLGLEGTE